MGSFNEICALSNQSIFPGNKVKLLFITRNPYDQGNGTKRNCYYNQNYFFRSLPIDAEYDDYGRFCNYENDPMTKIVEDLFHEDLNELEWGDNHFHDVPVHKNMNLDEIIEAGFEGRLSVKDVKYNDKFKEKLSRIFTKNEFLENDDEIPKVKKIKSIIDQKKFQIKGKNIFVVNEISKGFVRINLFSDFRYNYEKQINAKIESLQKLLSKTFSVKLQSKILFVWPKDLESKKEILYNTNFINNYFDNMNKLLLDITYPHSKNTPAFDNYYQYAQYDIPKNKIMPTVHIAILEDVWNAYVNEISIKSWDKTVNYKSLYEKVNLATEEAIESTKTNDSYLDYSLKHKLRELFSSIPYTTDISTHFMRFINNYESYNKDQIEQIKTKFAQHLMIIYIYSYSKKSLDPTLLGGQDELYSILKKINAVNIKIINKNLREYKKV